MKNRPDAKILPALLIAVGLLVYGNSLWGPFIYDDVPTLADPHVHSLWPPQRALWANKDSVAAGRPVVSLTLAINYAIGGHDVRGYHAVNIAVHLMVALALYAVIRLTLEREPLRGRFGPHAGPLAFACALLWMVHPVQTQCVNYISHRTESIMALFYLLTLYCAIRAWEPATRWRWTAASVLGCALGMASKEAMVTAPAMVVLYDWAFRTQPYRQVLHRRLGLYAGLAATWIILAALMSTGPRSSVTGFGVDVGVVQYALNQCMIVTHYLGLAFWPRPLIIDYGSPQALTIYAVAPYAALLAALLVATAAALVLRPPVGFLGAWFFVILAPTSSVVPILTEVGADRRMYLSLAGLIVGVVLAVHAALRRAAPRAAGRLGVALLAAAAAVLSWGTIMSNADYRNPMTLWETAARAVPDNAGAHNNLANELRRRGRIDEAVEQYRLAIRVDSDYVMARINLGNTLRDSGRADEAVGHYLDALEMLPADGGVSQVSYNLAKALVLLGKIDDAIAHFRRVIEIRPDLPDVHHQLALALGRKGDLAQAMTHFRTAIALRPGDPEAHFHYAIALRMAGRPEEAIDQLRRALEADPRHAAAHQNLGAMLQRKGKLDEAISHYRAALLAEPASAPANLNLGLALQATGRSDEAVVHLVRAADTYADAGQLDAAIAAAQQALAIATGPAADEIRERLQLSRRAAPGN